MRVVSINMLCIMGLLQSLGCCVINIYDAALVIMSPPLRTNAWCQLNWITENNFTSDAIIEQDPGRIEANDNHAVAVEFQLRWLITGKKVDQTSSYTDLSVGGTPPQADVTMPTEQVISIWATDECNIPTTAGQ